MTIFDEKSSPVSHLAVPLTSGFRGDAGLPHMPPLLPPVGPGDVPEPSPASHTYIVTIFSSLCRCAWLSSLILHQNSTIV